MTIERWTLRPTFELPGGVVGEFERCCVVDGPIVPPGETAEVVRADTYRGAVEENRILSRALTLALKDRVSNVSETKDALIKRAGEELDPAKGR